MNNRTPPTKLSPYQEAVRLSASIELRRGIHSAYLAIRDPQRQKATTYDANAAYQDALAMLNHAKIAISDRMVRDEIRHLRQLLRQVDPQSEAAA